MDSAEIIKTLRERAGLSRSELARRIGVCVQSVCNWEDRKASPTVDKIIAICNATGFELIIKEKYTNGCYTTEPPEPQTRRKVTLEDEYTYYTRKTR